MGNRATYALVEAGTVRFAYDHWGGHSAPADVLAGPAALPPEDQADEGAYLDVPARSLWVWERRTLDPRYLEGLRRRWPGWQVRGHIEGLVRQVALSGRDPGTVPGLVVPAARAHVELREELTRGLSYDGSVELPRIAGLIRAQDGPDAHIEINPEALGRHVPALSDSARRAIVDELIGTGTGTGTGTGETNLAGSR